jgi:hypothetical protein
MVAVARTLQVGMLSRPAPSPPPCIMQMAVQELRELRERYFDAAPLQLDTAAGSSAPTETEDPCETTVKNLGGPSALKASLVGYRARWSAAVAETTESQPTSASQPHSLHVEVLRLEGCLLPLLTDAATLVCALPVSASLPSLQPTVELPPGSC